MQDWMRDLSSWEEKVSKTDESLKTAQKISKVSCSNV
jgi:hypothetical protein